MCTKPCLNVVFTSCVTQIGLGNPRPYMMRLVNTVDPDSYYIFGLAVFGVVRLIHDGCNDLAIACG
ncbi:hypothetical protein LC609_19390 [Nostoc sp. XA013]|nr:hypothetical protein [Nostoc sp. XA013]